MKAGGGGLNERQASATQLRIWVCFETVRDFQGFVIVESEFARQFSRDVAVAVVRQTAPVKSCPHRFLVTSVCTGDSFLQLSQIFLFTIVARPRVHGPQKASNTGSDFLWRLWVFECPAQRNPLPEVLVYAGNTVAVRLDCDMCIAEQAIVF